MYPLFALTAGLVRCLHINRLYKLSERIWCKFCEVGVSACPLNKLFKVFYLSFLYFNLFLQAVHVCTHIVRFANFSEADFCKSLLGSILKHLTIFSKSATLLRS